MEVLSWLALPVFVVVWVRWRLGGQSGELLPELPTLKSRSSKCHCGPIKAPLQQKAFRSPHGLHGAYIQAAETKVAHPQISPLQVFICPGDGHCLLCSSQHWPSLGWPGAWWWGSGRDGPPPLMWPPLSSRMRMMRSPPWFGLAARLSGITCVSTCLTNGPVLRIRYLYRILTF